MHCACCNILHLRLARNDWASWRLQVVAQPDSQSCPVPHRVTWIIDGVGMSTVWDLGLAVKTDDFLSCL